MGHGSNSSSSSSLSKAIQLLSIISKAEVPLGFSEIVAETGLPKATVHRTLVTLQQERLVRFDERRDCYLSGFGLLELAHRAWAGIDVRDSAADQMKMLWQASGETVHLAVLDDGDVIYIDKIESSKSLRLFSAVGKKGPAYCTGVGKALMAFMDTESQAAAIAKQTFVKHTKATITHADALRERLDGIQQQGYALDEEEHEEGIRCVAAPILDHHGDVVAAISVTAPVFRTDDETFNSFIILIKKAAKEISLRLGYMGSKKTSS